MHAREDAIKRHLAQHPCKACHHSSQPEAMLVLVRRSRAWIVMATCGNCHHRGIFVVSFPAKRANLSPVSTEDVSAMHAFLDSFDGDFLTLFGQGPQGRLATD